jgi:predicted amino acid racemase
VFLDCLSRRNRPFVEAAAALHREGEIPASSYVLDLDAIRENARAFAREAAGLGLRVYAMTKQVGRNPAFMRTLGEAGIGAFVAVDMADARRIVGTGHRLGHLGHLVQVPRGESAGAAAMAPEHWTVFSREKASEAASAARRLGQEQALLARLQSEGDVFYLGHEGGFPAEEVARVADELDALPGVRFVGITTFPALLFDADAKDVRPTPNLATLERAAEELRRLGRSDVEVNAPGTTSIDTLATLASAGATQVEPGHGLTGTTPLHAVRDLPEVPAILYLSEVSHFHAGRAFCFGGGFYIDPVFPDYRLTALVGPDLELVPAEIPPPSAIDYYGILDVPEGSRVATGDTVVFGFRVQAFVTRAHVAAISGISVGAPVVAGVWTTDGEAL